MKSGLPNFPALCKVVCNCITFFLICLEVACSMMVDFDLTLLASPAISFLNKVAFGSPFSSIALIVDCNFFPLSSIARPAFNSHLKNKVIYECYNLKIPYKTDCHFTMQSVDKQINILYWFGAQINGLEVFLILIVVIKEGFIGH